MDYKARAEREAAALLAECGGKWQFGHASIFDRNALIDLLALAWLQGSIYGAHATLADAEVAFDNLRAGL